MDEAGGAVDGDEHEGGLPPTGSARSLPDFCNKIDPIRKSAGSDRPARRFLMARSKGQMIAEPIGIYFARLVFRL
jgi:hypothetical protein